MESRTWPMNFESRSYFYFSMRSLSFLACRYALERNLPGVESTFLMSSTVSASTIVFRLLPDFEPGRVLPPFWAVSYRRCYGLMISYFPLIPRCVIRLCISIASGTRLGFPALSIASDSSLIGGGGSLLFFYIKVVWVRLIMNIRICQIYKYYIVFL